MDSSVGESAIKAGARREEKLPEEEDLVLLPPVDVGDGGIEFPDDLIGAGASQAKELVS